MKYADDVKAENITAEHEWFKKESVECSVVFCIYRSRKFVFIEKFSSIMLQII